MPDVEGRIALVTGGARGLGVEVCRQLAQAGMTVWLTARDGDRAVAVAAELGSDGDVRAARLDITDPAEVEALAARIDRLDVLVNNAAIDFDTDAPRAHRRPRPGPSRPRDEPLRRLADGPGLHSSSACQSARPPRQRLQRRRLAGRYAPRHPRLQHLEGRAQRPDPEARRRTAQVDVLVNSVCPGWTATEMGGGGRPVAEGARSITWACLLDDNGPTGGFFRDGEAIEW